jgi:uncharacterized protein YegL
VFILDKSGSMSGLESDTIGGFNANIEIHKKLGGDVRVTTALFDNNYELLHDRIDIQAINPMTDEQYQVGGMTALLDAIGETVHKIRKVQKQTAEEFRAEKVIFVIITDGQENSSKEYKHADIKKLIEHQQKKYGWEFLFLGANIDAFDEARNLGIPLDHALNYVADRAGIGVAWASVGTSTSMLRKGKKVRTCIQFIEYRFLFPLKKFFPIVGKTQNLRVNYAPIITEHFFHITHKQLSPFIAAPM